MKRQFCITVDNKGVVFTIFEDEQTVKDTVKCLNEAGNGKKEYEAYELFKL